MADEPSMDATDWRIEWDAVDPFHATLTLGTGDADKATLPLLPRTVLEIAGLLDDLRHDQLTEMGVVATPRNQAAAPATSGGEPERRDDDLTDDRPTPVEDSETTARPAGRPRSKNRQAGGADSNRPAKTAKPGPRKATAKLARPDRVNDADDDVDEDAADEEIDSRPWAKQHPVKATLAILFGLLFVYMTISGMIMTQRG